jgi:hypothetical protein
VIPEKQFSKASRINFIDTGEVQYYVVTTRFLSRQDSRLNACGGVTVKLASEGDDFCLVLVLFTNLKHRTYLRVMKGVSLLFHIESLYTWRHNSPIGVRQNM